DIPYVTIVGVRRAPGRTYEPHDAVALSQQLADDVAADKSGSAGQEYLHGSATCLRNGFRFLCAFHPIVEIGNAEGRSDAEGGRNHRIIGRHVASLVGDIFERYAHQAITLHGDHTSEMAARYHRSGVRTECRRQVAVECRRRAPSLHVTEN